MPFYFAIYGYGITKRIEFANFVLFPVVEKSEKARKLSQDRNKFHLTAIGEIKGEPNPHELFDLAGALTFCQQQWVVVSRAYRFPEKTELENILEAIPPI